MNLNSLITFERLEVPVNENFEKWATSYAGCDGGDIGNPERRAIWLCGIEWGGTRSAEHIQAEILRDESRPREGYRADFKRAFHDESATFNHQTIDGRDLWWSVNADGTLVAIIPFMVNSNGLTRNDSIQKFGNRIAQLMEQHGCQ